MFEIDVRNGSAMLCSRAGEQHDASEINPIAQRHNHIRYNIRNQWLYEVN